nr:hypothetical protein CFP56_01338 [Quercus suber]
MDRTGGQRGSGRHGPPGGVEKDGGRRASDGMSTGSSAPLCLPAPPHTVQYCTLQGSILSCMYCPVVCSCDARCEMCSPRCAAVDLTISHGTDRPFGLCTFRSQCSVTRDRFVMCLLVGRPCWRSHGRRSCTSETLFRLSHAWLLTCANPRDRVSLCHGPWGKTGFALLCASRTPAAASTLSAGDGAIARMTYCTVGLGGAARAGGDLLVGASDLRGMLFVAGCDRTSPIAPSTGQMCDGTDWCEAKVGRPSWSGLDGTHWAGRTMSSVKSLRVQAGHMHSRSVASKLEQLDFSW